MGRWILGVTVFNDDSDTDREGINFRRLCGDDQASLDVETLEMRYNNPDVSLLDASLLCSGRQ